MAAFIIYMVIQSSATAGSSGDLDIYRGAINYARSGGDLYSYVYIHPTVHGLGFTYPPFAAILLTPFALLGTLAANATWAALSFTVLIGCLYVLVHRASLDEGCRPSVSPTRARNAGWVAGLAIVVMTAYPFVQNLIVAQASLFVVALALCDHLLPRRWQGVLVGLAGAIKLTPLVFLPYYLITRQWRQAAICTGSFTAATGLAFLVMPTESVTYWTDMLWQTGRVGRTDNTMNKSLLGFLTRQLPDGAPVTLIWLAVAAAVTALAYWRAAQHVRDRNLLAATLVVGVLSVAVSPISWPHHELWLVLAAAWLVMQKGWLPVTLGAALLIIFHGFPWFDDYPAGTVGVWMGAGVELPALAVLLILGFGLLPGRRQAPATISTSASAEPAKGIL